MGIKSTQRLQPSDDNRTRTPHNQGNPAQKAINPDTPNPSENSNGNN